MNCFNRECGSYNINFSGKCSKFLLKDLKVRCFKFKACCDVDVCEKCRQIEIKQGTLLDKFNKWIKEYYNSENVNIHTAFLSEIILFISNNEFEILITKNCTKILDKDKIQIAGIDCFDTLKQFIIRR